MDLAELKNLDLDVNKMGSWPGPIKAVAILLIIAIIVGAGFYFLTMPQLETLDKAERTEKEKRQTFEKKQEKAANLEPLKEQLADMKDSFGAMLRQLPNKAEIEGLLVDISQTGLAAGLEFDLFQPENEKPADFYAEKPIKLRVRGNYHDFGQFVSGVAALPRIVTQHDVIIQRDKEGELVMDATAKTYRYLDEEELAQATQSKKKAAKGKGKGSKPSRKKK